MFEYHSDDIRFREVWLLLDKASASDLDRAQSIIDECKERDGEWRYVQAAVFYYRSWFLECKRQLKKAMKLDPENEIYRSAYNDLIAMAAAAKLEGNGLPEEKHWYDGCGETCCYCCSELC